MTQNDPYGLIASGLPPEMAAEAMGLTRRQAIMQALLQQSMQPQASPTNKGRIESKASFLAPLAQMAQAYIGSKGMQDADAAAGDISARRQQAVADAMSGYERTKAGAPAQNIPYAQGMTADEEGNPMPPAVKDAVAGNPRAAVAQAMTNPMLRGNPLVLGDLKSLEKRAEPYSLRQGENRYVDDKPVAENAPKPVEHVIAGKVYVAGPNGQMVEKGGPGDPMAANRPFNTDGTPNKAYQNYEMLKANQGATRVQTSVNAFTPASEEAQKKFMDSTRTTYDQLKQAPVALESIEKAKALIPAAQGFVGPGGEGLLQAAKFMNNRMGMSINTEGVKSAEELRTRIFFNVMDNLKKMDAQPSEMQQKMMQEALGNLGTDPGALPAVLDAFGDAIKGKVELHNQEVAGAVSKGVKFPYDPTINLGRPKRRASDSGPAPIKFGDLPP